MDARVAALEQLGKRPRCGSCGKPRVVCICDRIPKPPIAVHHRVVILQHPQEKDVVLGTAPLLALALERCSIRPGLSWASLGHAVGDSARSPKRWAVLFVTPRPDGLAAALAREPVLLIDPNKRAHGPRDLAFDGVLAIDGTWSQAKTLWWRNPWLTKLVRISLVPREPSLYGRLREEPKRGWVSTLEAVADVLAELGEDEHTRTELRRILRTLLQRTRQALRTAAE